MYPDKENPSKTVPEVAAAVLCTAAPPAEVTAVADVDSDFRFRNIYAQNTLELRIIFKKLRFITKRNFCLFIMYLYNIFQLVMFHKLSQKLFTILHFSHNRHIIMFRGFVQCT